MNFSDKQEFDLLQEGEREVILEEIIEKTPQNGGNKFLNLKWRIRDDVDQPDAGRVMFESIFKDKNTNDYRSGQISALLRAQGKTKEEGGTYDFDDYDELMQFLTGLNARITIIVEKANEYHDDDVNKVKYCSYKPTNHAPATLSPEAQEFKKQQSLNTNDIDDEDVPF